LTIKLADLEISPPVLLAPMAGITDLPFRRLVARFGAGLVVSEMVASQEMVQAKPGVRERAALGLDADGTAVQLAGRDPHWLAEAARMVEANGARLIDFNMGCPAKKVVNGWSGSALMRDPDNAVRLVQAVVSAVSVPVTVKMRLGWDDESRNAAAIARRLADTGVRMIVVHGRTRAQFYKGRADWAAIGEVVDAVSLPVIANGDIVDVPSARRALELSGAAGVMVGRGAQGRPWLLAGIAHALFGAPSVRVPAGGELLDMIATHYEDMLSFYGKALGMRVARKHLGWYLDDLGAPKALRRAVLTGTEPRQVMADVDRAIRGERLVA